MSLFLPIGITLLTAGALALTRKKGSCTFDEVDRTYVKAVLSADLTELLKREATVEKPNPTRKDVAASIRLLADRAAARGCSDDATNLRRKADEIETGE